MGLATTLRTDRDMLGRLDEVAKNMGKSRNWAINKAIEAFVDYNEWYISKVNEGIQSANEGNFATQEEIDSVFSTYGA